MQLVPLYTSVTSIAGGGGGAQYSGGFGTTMSAGGMASSGAGPPPDLPSLLLNARIVYIGMPLLPAVGLCRLNSFDPYPITYSLSNP